MKQFKCNECGSEFEAKGKRTGWQDAVMGACWHFEAECPTCGAQAPEYRKAMRASGDNEPAAVPSCPTGTCPFVN